MHQCRKAIRDTGAPASAELADKPALALREAVRESGLLMHSKGAFIASNTGNAAQDALRRLVVDLFQVSHHPCDCSEGSSGRQALPDS